MSARGRIGQRKLMEYAQSGFVSIDKAAAILGVNRRSVERMLEAGTLSNARIGGRRLIPLQALHDYMTAQIRVGSVA